MKTPRLDARALSYKNLTELRRRGVQAVQQGESPEVVARALGIARQTIYNWLTLYRHGGWDALDARRRGGRRRKLNGEALRWIYDTVTQKNPLQLRFPFALWTCGMVSEVIYGRFKIRLSRASVGRLMHQLGLSAQRPLWRAYQQDPRAIEGWLKEEFPRIEAEARRLKAKIYFGDEAGIRSDFHSGTTWGIRGKTPIVSGTGARVSLNMISAVNRLGQLRFMVTSKRIGARVFVEFLKRLIHGAEGMIFLIVDRHPAHRAKIVQAYLKTVSDRLRLYFLPPYAPELNPDEYVWNDLKNNAVGRMGIKGLADLKRAAVSHLRFLQKTPERVRSFFCAPSTQYAL